MTRTIGILAYGSLIGDPGDELKAATTDIIEGVTTPFRIEFARSSKTRNGAPTLVPVDTGGAAVEAIVYKLNTTEAEAADMLYRRETNQIGSARSYRKLADKPDAMQIDNIATWAGCDLVLYTRFPANITPLTAERLAALAIESARANTTGRDGISYLINAKLARIITPLSGPYEQAILRQTGARDLAVALDLISSERHD